jgi:zinc protease
MIGRRAAAGGLLAASVVLPRRPARASLLDVQRRPSETFTLANGLQVVVLPSKRAPIVMQLLVYRIGSAD